MLKFIFVGAVCAAALGAHADGLDLKPCPEGGVDVLLESVAQSFEGKQAGLQKRLVVNDQNKPVGVYAWAKEKGDFFFEVCDDVGSNVTDITVASSWSYSDGETRLNRVRKGETLFLSQDEGRAELRVVKASKDGNIQAELKIIGWDEASEDHIVRQSKIKFKDL